jgi:hypothetical protein
LPNTGSYLLRTLGDPVQPFDNQSSTICRKYIAGSFGEESKNQELLGRKMTMHPQRIPEQFA